MNLFDLFARITLDDEDYKKKLGENEGRTSAFANTLKSGLAAAGKAAAAGLAAASTAAVAVGKAALDSYADFEQLIGGTELMFGDAYDIVASNAAEAYKTVQMSQNEYLQQVNGFATGLKTALGGNEKAAADLAHRIIQAEADVVAATGNTAENVQNAFNGIMKSNFTMLDNLQIGITPTKEGFQEVIDKVNEWNTANGEATAYQMGNLADMQSALVDYIEMVGMSGYAQNEAAGTISGSIAMVKASWSNLLTALADPVGLNIGGRIDELVEGIKTVAKNVVPVAKEILGGMGSLVSELAPIITDALPGVVTAVLPPMLEAGAQLLGGLVSGIVSALPALAEAAMTAVGALGTVLSEQGPVLIESAKTLIDMLYNGFLEAVPALLPVGVQIVTDLANKATDPDTLSNIVDAAITMITTLTESIIDAIPQLLEAAPKIIGNLAIALVQNFPKIGEAAIKLIDTLFNGIMDNASRIWDTAGEIIGNLVGAFADLFPDVVSIGLQIVEGIWTGIKNMKETFRKNIKSFFTGIVDGVKNVLGIHSPSRVFAEIGGYMASGLGEGWDKQYGSIKSDIEGGLHFDAASVDFADSGMSRIAKKVSGGDITQPIVITVQSILDGRIIGETSYRYAKEKERAFGGA